MSGLMRYVIQSADDRLISDGINSGKTNFLPPLWGLYQDEPREGEKTTLTFQSTEGVVSQVSIKDIVVLLHYNPLEKRLPECPMRIWAVV